MAEVKINITAEDRASSVFAALGAGVETMRSGAVSLAAAFKDVEARTIAASSGALEYAGRIAGARAALAGLSSDMNALDLTRSVVLDVSEALSGARALRDAIDAIPDVTHKSVIVEYKTKASPVRPFTEGMEHIRQAMESLPAESVHTVRYIAAEGSQSDARSFPAPQPRPLSGASFQNPAPASALNSSQAPLAISAQPQVNFAPNITVMAGAASLAEELDSALAGLWLRHRSELRRAIEQ